MLPSQTQLVIRLVATETGWYKVEAINPTGCSPFSIAERVLVQPIPDPKIINASVLLNHCRSICMQNTLKYYCRRDYFIRRSDQKDGNGPDLS